MKGSRRKDRYRIARDSHRDGWRLDYLGTLDRIWEAVTPTVYKTPQAAAKAFSAGARHSGAAPLRRNPKGKTPRRRNTHLTVGQYAKFSKEHLDWVREARVGSLLHWAESQRFIIDAVYPTSYNVTNLDTGETLSLGDFQLVAASSTTRAFPGTGYKGKTPKRNPARSVLSDDLKCTAACGRCSVCRGKTPKRNPRKPAWKAGEGNTYHYGTRRQGAEVTRDGKGGSRAPWTLTRYSGGKRLSATTSWPKLDGAGNRPKRSWKAGSLPAGRKSNPGGRCPSAYNLFVGRQIEDHGMTMTEAVKAWNARKGEA